MQVQVGRVRLPRLIPLASVVAVFQVVDERELDLVAGLQDEARTAQRSVVRARFERRVRRLAIFSRFQRFFARFASVASFEGLNVNHDGRWRNAE